MKTIKTQIKTIMLLLLFSTNIYAQNEIKKNRMFVRVYNFEGKKISKGKVLAVSDTLLTLKRNSKIINLDFKNIGFIKTKRSAGHNVLMGAAIGSTTASVISVASINPDDGAFIWDTTPDNVGEALVGGVIGGGIIGASIGALTIPFKNSETYIINGSQENWSLFQKIIKK